MTPETVAVSIAVFESVKTKAYRSHLAMIAEMARRIEPENLWLLDPRWERRTYPFCVQGMVDLMLVTEKDRGEKVDWFFWLEDDIIPAPDVYFRLRAVADIEERPYVAALAYCRTRPYFPGVATIIQENGIRCAAQWQDAPHEGVVPVDRVGMCAALFHRSIFDRVSQPWFGVDVASDRGIGPDAFWCSRLKAHGIQPYLCCDVTVGHLGEPPIITQEISEQWNAQRKLEQP